MYDLKFLSLVALSGLAMTGYAVAQGTAENADDVLSGQVGVVQDVTPAQNLIEMSVESARAENDDPTVRDQKLSLAREMHNIRPTAEQVDSAVRRASYSLPPQDRANFEAAMRNILNYNAIERVSVDAMVETYSRQELEAMVAYYSKPEARSASDKTALWAAQIQPEIIRMIDKAMMRIRTGQ